MFVFQFRGYNTKYGAPANKFLFPGGAPANKFLFPGGAPANKFLFPGGAPANNLFLCRKL